MKKRVLSLLMALALCFTMLPTAALAQQTGAADVYTTGEDTAVQDKQAAEAVRAAQALIDALPDEVTADNAEEIAAQLANLDETLAALTEEQLAALDMARYEALCEQLAAQVSLTAERGGEHADHPICGDASCNKHGASLTDWVGVSELSDDMEEGYYYLTGPVTRTSTWYPKDGVVLCLNGYSISMDVKNSNNDSTICVNGGVTFTLCDCQNKGTVTHGMNGAARYTGSGVWVENGNGAGKANFVLYSGSISGNEYDNASIKFGAGVHLGANASFTMHGGSISGNKTAGYGGGVYVQAGTTSFTMTGGTITGNSAGHDGGGVYVKNGSFTMTGGTISGNTAGSGCNGGGVYADINANVTLSGAPVITENKDADGTVNNVYLDKDEVYGEGGTFIGEGGLSSTSSIGVTVDAGRLPTTDGGYTTIAEAAEGYTITADDAKRLSADAGTGYSVRQKDNTLVLVKGELPQEHPICGAAHKDIGDHTGACADVTWTAWDGVSDITYDANNTAYVYLRDNAERDSALEIANGYTLYLCLSGHSLTKNKTGKSVIKVGDNATLSLCDCSDAQSGKLTHGTTARGSKYEGHGVSLGYRSTFNMYGGSITGNRADTGGGVSLASEYSYAKFNMYGGSITNNAATNGDGGGGVHNLFGTFTMYGGSITGNSADTRCGGGGVYLARMGEFVMKGGEITGNTAKNGGGVYANGSTAFTMKDGTIGGSTAADANAAKYGGGVYVKNGTFTMSGGKVTGNSATEGGGGVRLDKGTFNMSGSAVISRNTADGYGGGVDVNNGSFTMSGGSITGNTTTGDDANFCGGGGVDVYNGGSFTMSGGSITGNNSLRGGGVELNGSGTMTVSGSVQITDNWQNGTLDSSGVYVKGSKGKANNLYLYSTKTVAIDTAGLHAGAHIGVSTEDWPDPGSPVKIATNATNEESHYTAIFTPDAEDADYKIIREADDTLYLGAHEHTWRYTASGDTISAACDECGWNGGSVTIKAPEHTVYGDGKSPEAQVDKNNWLPTLPADAITYRKGNTAIAAPTDAGSYTGVLTIGGVEATVDYTIGRKTVSAGDVTFSHTHTTYDGTQKNVADVLVVTVDGKTLTPGTDYVVFGTTSASDFEEEGYNARIALQGNYEGTVPFRWHIDPREVELEPVNAADRRYGDGKGNVTLRVTNAVGNDRVSVTVTGGDDLSVGTHSVTATALDRPEYTLPADAAKRTLTYSVGKGKVDQVNLTMYVYNNVAKTHTYDFSQALPALADGLTYGTCSYTGKTNLNANVVSGIGFNGSVLTFRTGRISSRPGTLILSYTATVKSDNYEDFKLLLYVQTKDKTVVDLPEADITMEGWSYGQTPNQPSVANLPAGAAPTFTYKDANGAEFTPAKTTDAGAYTVTVRYETEDTVHTGTRSFTVAPKTLTAEDIGEYGPSGIIPNKTYDGGTGIDLTGLGVKKAALVGTDENLIISGSAEFAGANAGDTTLVFTTDGELCEIPGVPGKASNYQIAAGLTKPFAARIDQRWLDFTVDSVSKRFGSPDSTADVRVTFTGVAGNNKSGLVSGETLVQGVDYDVTAVFTRTTMGEDNNVTVTVTLKDTETARNYTLAGGGTVTGVTGTITKAAAPVIPEQTLEIYSNAKTIYPIDLTKDWPAGAPALSDYIHDRNSPYLEAEELSDLLYNNASYMIPGPDDWNGTIYLNAKAFTADVGTDLGVLKVTLRSENYEDVTIRVRVKVKAKTQQALSVSIEGWTYGSTPSQPVYGAPGGTVSGPDITYTSRDGATSYGATAPTDAGDYTVTIRYESIDTIWSGSADFTISKKQITPPAADTTVFTYTADEQTYALAASPDYTVSDNTVQTNVGDYTILVSLNDTANTEWADGTTEEKAYTFSIGPAALTVTALDKEILVGQSAPELSDPAEGTDYRVEGLLGADVLTGVTLTYGETPDTGRMGSYAIHAAAAQANYDVACVSGTLTIRKAAAPVLADIPFSCKYTLTGEQTVDVSGLVPGAEGYTLGAAAGETAIVSGAAVDAEGVVTYTLTGAGKAGDSVTLPVTISSARYEDAAVNVVITLLPRDNQAALRVTGGTTVVYGETLQLGTSGGSGTGAVTYTVTNGTGKATIDANGVLTPVQVGAVTVTATKAGDDAYNDVTSAAVTVTVTKAKPTGEPSYKQVTGRGKTLKDAALTIEGGSLSLKDGTLEWLDEDGNVLPDDTVIEANKSYFWHFTPTDGNYTDITSSEPIKLYSPAEDDTGHGNSHNYRTITVTVRGNGSVSPSGWANVPIGGDQTFTITPDKGYAVAKVLIDGRSVGAVTSYTFRGITEGHTIEVIFMKANGNPQTGVDMGQRTVGCGR